MNSVRQAIVGRGNRANTVMGFAGFLIVAGDWLMTGKVDNETLMVALGMIAAGLGFSRGGGTGSDTPAAKPKKATKVAHKKGVKK